MVWGMYQRRFRFLEEGKGESVSEKPIQDGFQYCWRIKAVNTQFIHQAI